MRRILLLLPFTLLTFGPKAFAQSESAPSAPVSLSLKQCIEYAEQFAPAAKNARLDVELQKAQNAEITGRALPQISADGKYTQFIDVQQAFLPAVFLNPAAPVDAYVPVAFSPKLSSVGQVNATQVLFSGSLFVALQARKALIDLAQSQSELKLQDIRFNVQKAYYGLLIANEQKRLMNESLRLLRTSARDLQITYETGLIEKLEADRMNVQLSNLEADSMNLAASIEVAEKMLKFSIGMDLNTPVVLTDADLIEHPETSTALMLRDEPYESRLSYRLAETGLRLQQYDLKRYRFEGLPTLAAFGGAGYNRSAAKFDDLINKPYPGFQFVGLQLTVPIFDGLQRRNRVRAAKVKVQQSENDLENAKRGIDFETRSARVTLTNAVQSLESRRRTMDLANGVLGLTKKKYEAGVGSNQDVVLAQSDLLQAQNNYFSALQALFNAQTDLQKALGLLN